VCPPSLSASAAKFARVRAFQREREREREREGEEERAGSVEFSIEFHHAAIQELETARVPPDASSSPM